VASQETQALSLAIRRPLEKARDRGAPDRATTRARLVTGLGGASLATLAALIAFAVMLCQSGPGLVCRFYVLCCLAPLFAAAGAGGGVVLVVLGLNELGKSPELKQLQARQRQADAKGDRKRAIASRKRGTSRTDQFQSDKWRFGMLAMAGSVIVFVVATIGQGLCFSVLLYKLWAAVQDGRAQDDARHGAGRLLHPFFNFYWAFVALPGVAQRAHRCADNASLDVPRASEGLMTAYCILCLLAIVPFLGALAVLVNIGVAIAAFRSATRVAEALADEA